MLIRFDVDKDKLGVLDELAPINMDFCEAFCKNHRNGKFFRIVFMMNSGRDFTWEFSDEKVRDKIYDFLQDRYVEVL